MRVATDVGGTFTDLVYYSIEQSSGEVSVLGTAKVDTTPPDFEEGVMNSLEKARLNPADFEFFAHGTTVVINALTERKGVKTALLTTRGFRDVLEIARGNRPDLFNFNFRKPKPFVERYLRVEVEERVNYKGEIQKAVDTSSLADIVENFRNEGVEAIAVCLMHAYTNPENEIKVIEELRRLAPEMSVIASNEISREWREYERSNTTALSAYIHPIAKRYLEFLESKLAKAGYQGSPYIMQSNCGISTVDSAKRNPISMVESGPASGIYAAAHLGRIIDEKNLIVLDIGGTTAKCTLIEDGEIRITTDYYIEKNDKCPGYPIQTPVSEIVEIGNGGGSIAWVDEGRKLHVGPQSAGASPGPAAYGKGGTQVTTTDANLVLGRIDKNSFVGGEVEPDMKALEQAFQPLMKKLGMTIEELARGVIRIANFNMTNALRLVSTNKGYDPRDFSLIAFGGGGAMHAVALAEELKVPKVIVPVNSAVFSAWGMLLTDLRRDYVQTQPLLLDDKNVQLIKDRFQILQSEAQEEFKQDKMEVSGAPISFEHFADMRYSGQEHTVKIPFPITDAGDIDLGAANEAFHQAHEHNFTYRLGNDVQIVNFHLVAKVLVEKPDPARKKITGIKIEDTILHKRIVDYDAHGIHEATIYDGDRLEPGMQLSGPAVIQEPSTTLVVAPGHRVSLDDFGNYHVLISQTED
ncbi:MAG: hydantoinase/oxoprolinase family protein [Gammaproteobacteria bacterium]|nr:hydantoinase/oxoprolinase family protein [Gammaproteobacteria bacterium]